MSSNPLDVIKGNRPWQVEAKEFIRVTSLPLSDREWKVVKRNMAIYYSMDGFIEPDARVVEWFGGEVPTQTDWGIFAEMTDEVRSTTPRKPASESRREYHRLYQRRRRAAARLRAMASNGGEQ